MQLLPTASFPVKRFLLALLLVGCGSTFTAEPADYALYRKTRIAKTSEARLVASHRYLKEKPDGRWHEEVGGWFSHAEPVYFARAKSSEAGLREYLSTLPDGPHASAAAELIEDMTRRARYERARSEETIADAKAVTERLEDADLLRREVVTTLARWTGLLSGISTWARPTSALGSEFIYRFRLERPSAHCDDSHCKKSMALLYAVPDGKKLAARKAVFDVDLELYRAGVVRARLMGPELFSRAGEASEVRAVRPADAQARAEAIARAVQIVENALDARYLEPECKKEPVSPVVLLRECGGVRVRMTAAPSVEEDDELVVEPMSAP